MNKPSINKSQFPVQRVKQRIRLRFPRPFRTVFVLAAVVSLGLAVAVPAFSNWDDGRFRRVASFPVFLNTCADEPDSCVDTQTVAEIVAASTDGQLLIYTDSATENVGFVDIWDPSNPQPAGLVGVGGEPTSVGVVKDYALAVVNTSADFVNTSGVLQVIHIPSRMIVRTIDLGGQPDSIAVSPSHRYAAVVIENERNEDLCVGGDYDGQEVDEDLCEEGGGELGILPQAPPGFLTIVDLVGPPSQWTTREISLVGLADRDPTDPEPEFVDINKENVAVVTLQENNYIVLVHLPTGNILNHFSAGDTDLSEIDTVENRLIELADSQLDRLREPDAVAWISCTQFVTANEGDLDGGSRGFTVFGIDGSIHFEAGNSYEHLVARLGHYPEERSENKGSEPEGAEYGKYGSQRYLFVGSERSSVVAVYELDHTGTPELVQVLPSSLGPEGLLAIPKKNLFVTASEEDDREAGIRSHLTLYELEDAEATYPTIFSANRPDGLPIPWGSLSAVAGDLSDPDLAYTVYDGFYRESRIFTVDVSMEPALITQEIVLSEGGHTLDLDLEGIAVRAEGGFWVVSEGAGSAGDQDRTLNQLVRVESDGTVVETIALPDEVNQLQTPYGFHGVASVGSGDGELVYVAFQREWGAEDYVRIGRYEVATGQWAFFYYEPDFPESPNGGWVGLAEIVALDDDTFAVIERDDQAGPDARIKRIYQFSVAGLTPAPAGGVFPLVTKYFVRDLIPDLTQDNGPVLGKVEGLGVLADGDTLIVTDNDGVDDSSGETQFLKLGDVFGSSGPGV